jgi:hypothetical protein
MTTRYYLTLPDSSRARGGDPALAFTAHSAEGFAEQLQDALRERTLFDRWRLMQPEPDEVDPALGATDPLAQVHGQQQDLHINLVVTSVIPGTVLKHRLRLLAGSHWELRDVTAA